MSRALQCFKLLVQYANTPVYINPSLKSYNLALSPSRRDVFSYISTFGFLQSISLFAWKKPAETAPDQQIEEKDENAEEAEEQGTSVQDLIARADEMYEEGLYEAVLALLRGHEASGDVELLWRMSRCLYILSLRTESQLEHAQLVQAGCDLLAAALSINDGSSAAHKWYSILLDAKMAQEGPLARFVEQSTVKRHMERATELNPGDSSTLHMLGNWCFNMSADSWYRRVVRRLLTPASPSSSYEEALRYFLKAEEVNPMFHSNNLLMLGITYLRLRRPDLARKYLLKAAEFPAQSAEDREVKQRAAETLRQISSKLPIFDTIGF